MKNYQVTLANSQGGKRFFADISEDKARLSAPVWLKINRVQAAWVWEAQKRRGIQPPSSCALIRPMSFVTANSSTWPGYQCFPIESRLDGPTTGLSSIILQQQNRNCCTRSYLSINMSQVSFNCWQIVSYMLNTSLLISFFYSENGADFFSIGIQLWELIKFVKGFSFFVEELGHLPEDVPILLHKFQFE